MRKPKQPPATSKSTGQKSSLKPQKRKAPDFDMPSAEISRKIAEVRSKVRESFGNVAMAMMMLPRYRHQTLADLQHLLLEPLIRDRIAIAYTAADGSESETKDSKSAQQSQIDKVSGTSDVAGMAIWASVSEEVDAKIRQQIKTGTFPVRLKSEDWTSGDINWLFDIIAPNQKTTLSVITNFKQVVKDGDLRLHPMITKLIDKDSLEKMGAKPVNKEEVGGMSVDGKRKVLN